MTVRRFDAIVVGAGQGGVPLAVAFARSGRTTALIEQADVGIDVMLDSSVGRVDGAPGAVRLTVEGNGATRPIEGSHVLIATGRTPNSENTATRTRRR